MKKATLILIFGAFALSVNSQIVVPLNLPDNCNISTGEVVVPLEETTAKLTVFPNPNDGNFTVNIKSTKLIGNVELVIFNLLGVEYFKQKIYCNSKDLIRNVNVSGLPPGLYYIKVRSVGIDLSTSFIIQK